MIKIIGLFPLTGNGGIASWSKKYLATFPDNQFNLYPTTNAPKSRKVNEGILSRAISGISILPEILKGVNQIIKKEKPQIIHACTSGSLGTLRDYLTARLCKIKGVKTIMHCHYGCVAEDISAKGPAGSLLRITFRLYDQIWVLDTRSLNAVKSFPEYSEKVRLTPNSITVNDDVDLSPKQYRRVGFVGNLFPSKGLYELVEAATKTDVRLDIIGPGTAEVIQRVKEIAGDKIDKTIFIHGLLPNDKAVEFIKQLDIIALPTYYTAEAFPISILEAMSNGKMVISCPRAAIKDMLTDLDGNECGMLVKEKSSQDIVDAINWLQSHKEEADKMCEKSYEKVKTCYDTKVVYDIYRNNYRDLLKN